MVYTLYLNKAVKNKKEHSAYIFKISRETREPKGLATYSLGMKGMKI